MRNFLKLAGVFALAAAIAFTMTACPPEDVDDNGGGGGGGGGVGGGGSGSGGPTFLGAKLVFSGEQVYTETYNETNNTVTYSEYKGNLTLDDNNGGTVTITSGKFSYTIETPSNLETWDILDFFDSYNNVTASASSVKYFMFGGFSKYDDDTNTTYYLGKENRSVNIGSISDMFTYEYVMYVYVDKDVTINGE
jgi:hypothetical protein